jgi:hypothetical protein
MVQDYSSLPPALVSKLHHVGLVTGTASFAIIIPPGALEPGSVHHSLTSAEPFQSLELS